MSSKYILLIEDDNNDEVLAKLALQENSIQNELMVLRDGHQALEFLFARGKHSDRNPRELPQVILLDLKLPKVSGLEVLNEIRSNAITRYVPVVIFTSSKEESDLKRSYQLGANAFVAKPVDFSEYSAAIQQLGLFWGILNKTCLVPE